jgi:hypothetical protein
MRAKIVELIPIQQAMDNLASIVGINIDSPPPMGIVQGTRIVTQGDELDSAEVRWISGEGAEVLLEVLDQTYRSIDAHLHHLYESKEMDWAGNKSRDGIAAIMSLVGESAPKMDAYLAYRFDTPPAELVEEREAFKKLHRFYSEQFAKRFLDGVEGKEAWNQSPVKGGSRSIGAEKDFESLIRDLDYELFYIVDEKGEYYLDDKRLRNLKLTVEFDMQGSSSFEEDPFLKMNAMLDRDVQASALQILTACREEIQAFYQKRGKLITFTVTESLNKAIMALFLTANPKHLLQRTTKKNSGRYFHDFHLFLREALKVSEYQKWLAYPPEEIEAKILLNLTWKLCNALVERVGGIKQEAIGLIYRTMRRGEEIQPKEELHRGKSIWEQLLYDDEKFRTLLKQFPKGPLLKVLEMVRMSREEGVVVPFDPWIQGSLPLHLYTLRHKKHTVDVLRMAAPIRQGMINRVEIVDEFRGFLLSLASENKKHLLIQLQDPLSWKEAARSKAVEEIAKNKNFSSQLMVLTLPKNTDFYHQKGEYSEQGKATEFVKNFKGQINSHKESGFHFPDPWKKKDLESWVDSALTWVHQELFAEKATLTRREREDFIEIFYQLMMAEAIVHLEVDSISFTCKDAVDTGALASGLLYGTLQLIQQGALSKEQVDVLRYLFYFPALSVRERAPDPEQCNRALSALDTLSRAIEEHGKKLFQGAVEGLEVISF